MINGQQYTVEHDEHDELAPGACSRDVSNFS